MPGLSSVFDWIILSSIMGSILVFLILVVKFAFKTKLGANWHYYIWLLLLLRLIIPFTPECPMSIYNIIKQDPEQIVVSNYTHTFSGIGKSSMDVAKVTSITPTNPNSSSQLNSGQSKVSFIDKPVPANLNWKAVLILLWLIGGALLAVYTLFINLKLWYQIRTEPKINSAAIIQILENCKSDMNISNSISVIATNNIRAPALFGLINPRLLLPDSIIKSLTDDELKYICLHELAHYKRKDILINWITIILQILHWFNPVIWYGFYRMHQDCELACDRLVLSLIEPAKHKEYGHTIIHVLQMTLTPQWIPGVTGILSGKSHIKRRITMISNFRKESLSLSIAAVIIFLIIGVVGCTNPQDSDVLQPEADIDKSSYNQLLNDLQNSQILAGTVDVEGPGIVVTLSDKETNDNSSQEEHSSFVIHDNDILTVINELAAAGAEAISVNEERLIANSEVRNAGNFILINCKKCASPFIIKAIGDPQMLESGIRLRGGRLEALEKIGLGISIKTADVLSIPKYKEELNFKYARAIADQSESDVNDTLVELQEKSNELQKKLDIPMEKPNL